MRRGLFSRRARSRSVRNRLSTVFRLPIAPSFPRTAGADIRRGGFGCGHAARGMAVGITNSPCGDAAKACSARAFTSSGLGSGDIHIVRSLSGRHWSSSGNRCFRNELVRRGHRTLS